MDLQMLADEINTIKGEVKTLSESLEAKSKIIKCQREFYHPPSKEELLRNVEKVLLTNQIREQELRAYKSMVEVLEEDSSAWCPLVKRLQELFKANYFGSRSVGTSTDDLVQKFDFGSMMFTSSPATKQKTEMLDYDTENSTASPTTKIIQVLHKKRMSDK